MRRNHRAISAHRLPADHRSQAIHISSTSTGALRRRARATDRAGRRPVGRITRSTDSRDEIFSSSSLHRSPSSGHHGRGADRDRIDMRHRVSAHHHSHIGRPLEHHGCASGSYPHPAMTPARSSWAVTGECPWSLPTHRCIRLQRPSASASRRICATVSSTMRSASPLPARRGPPRGMSCRFQ